MLNVKNCLSCLFNPQSLPPSPGSRHTITTLPLSTSGSLQCSSGSKEKQTQAGDRNHFPWRFQFVSELLGREGQVAVSWPTLTEMKTSIVSYPPASHLLPGAL